MTDDNLNVVPPHLICSKKLSVISENNVGVWGCGGVGVWGCVGMGVRVCGGAGCGVWGAGMRGYVGVGETWGVSVWVWGVRCLSWFR